MELLGQVFAGVVCVVFFGALFGFCLKIDDRRAEKYKEKLRLENPKMTESELEDAKQKYREQLRGKNK